MEKSNIEQVPYSLPETKADITLGQWIKYLPFDDDKVDAEIRISKMIEIFCGIPSRKLSQIKKSEIDYILQTLSNVFKEETQDVIHIVHNGIHYARIPDFGEHITQGELIDLDKYATEKDYARFLSILYRPIKKYDKITGLYTIEPYTGTHELFLDLRYDIYENASVFFWNTSLKLLNCSLNFIGKEVEKKLKMNGMNPKIYHQQVNLLKDGVRIWN
jgi:hypothetical protein